MPWTLRFPFDTVDARVFARQAISELRRDPAVTDVQLNPALPRSAWFDTLLVQVEFLEGHDQPADAVLAERLLAFRPRREPPTPWPYDPPVPEDDEQPVRQRGMLDNFNYIYGPRQDRPNENGDHFTPELRQQLIQQYIGTAEGRTRLAASMAAPLRARMDYQSVARRTFLVEQLPDGALPTYDRDVNVTDIVAPPTDPPDFILPGWIQDGVWARSKSDGRIAEIEKVLRPEDPPGRNGPIYVRVQTWRVALPEGCDVIAAYRFADLWEPCEKPADPRMSWERLLDDDEF